MTAKQILDEHGDNLLTAVAAFGSAIVYGVLNDVTILPDYNAGAGLISTADTFLGISATGNFAFLTYALAFALFPLVIMMATNDGKVGFSALMERPKNLPVGEWVFAVSAVVLPVMVARDTFSIATNHFVASPTVQVIGFVTTMVGILIVNYR
jgi:hypothetical protein